MTVQKADKIEGATCLALLGAFLISHISTTLWVIAMAAVIGGLIGVGMAGSDKDKE